MTTSLEESFEAEEHSLTRFLMLCYSVLPSSFWSSKVAEGASQRNSGSLTAGDAKPISGNGLTLANGGGGGGQTVLNGSPANINNNNHAASTKRRWREIAKSAFLRNRTNTHKNNAIKNGSNGTVTKNGSGGGVPNGGAVLSEIVQSLDPKELSLLQLLALNSLELSAPASDVLLKSSPTSSAPPPTAADLLAPTKAHQLQPQTNGCKNGKSWVQCSGHEGVFAPAAPGTIWKKVAAGCEFEQRAYDCLMQDVMRDAVPKYYGDIRYKEDEFIEMEDLLHTFGPKPSIMDIKMGTRTFLESEASNSKPRTDLYEKMVKVDPNAPSEEEHANRAVTKLRYMQFRETLSSSSNLGFRIEGVKSNSADSNHQKEDKFLPLAKVKNRSQTEPIFNQFLANDPKLRVKLVTQLKELRDKFSKSEFFGHHEVIGSSLLIVHDGSKVGVWMIDFAKTVPLPEGLTIDHQSPWQLGNHEDGYLFGLNNLIDILENLDCN